MKPDDFAGYRPHQIRRLLRRGGRPVALRAREKDAPGEGTSRTQESSLFPGGNVRLLTSAPEWAFGPKPLPTFPGPGDPARIDASRFERARSVSERSESVALLARQSNEPPETAIAPDQAGLPGTPENQKEDIALQALEVSAPQAHEEKDDMNDNSSFTEPEFSESTESEENFQEPEIELPLPVIVALQEREARRQNGEVALRAREKEFAGAAPTDELAGASSAPSGSHASHVPEERASVRGSKLRNKQLMRAKQHEDISPNHHSPRCTICNHPERKAIEQGFLHWESPTLLAYEYDLGQRRAVYRHARAFGLFEKRAARTRRSLEFVIEQGEIITPTADSLIRAVRAYSCLGEDGRWTEPTKRVIITHEHIDVVREADSGSPLRSEEGSGRSPASSTQPLASSHEVLGRSRASSVRPLASSPVTLGDGHAVPSISAVSPAAPTKPRKLMDTLFARLTHGFPLFFLAALSLCFLASCVRASSSTPHTRAGTIGHRIDRLVHSRAEIQGAQVAGLSADGGADFLDEVVAHALQVPGLIGGLNVTGGIGGATGKHVVAGGSVPLGSPRAPGERAGGFSERGIRPSAIDAELDA